MQRYKIVIFKNFIIRPVSRDKLLMLEKNDNKLKRHRLLKYSFSFMVQKNFLEY